MCEEEKRALSWPLTIISEIGKTVCDAHCDGRADIVAFVLMTSLFLIYPPDDSLFSLCSPRGVVKSELSNFILHSSPSFSFWLPLTISSADIGVTATKYLTQQSQVKCPYHADATKDPVLDFKSQMYPKWLSVSLMPILSFKRLVWCCYIVSPRQFSFWEWLPSLVRRVGLNRSIFLSRIDR